MESEQRLNINSDMESKIFNKVPKTGDWRQRTVAGADVRRPAGETAGATIREQQ